MNSVFFAFILVTMIFVMPLSNTEEIQDNVTQGYFVSLPDKIEPSPLPEPPEGFYPTRIAAQNMSIILNARSLSEYLQFITTINIVHV